MNWIGWVIFTVLLSMLLVLMIVPYVVLGMGWGILSTGMVYLYINFLIWLICEGELSYWQVMYIPFLNLWDWIRGR